MHDFDPVRSVQRPPGRADVRALHRRPGAPRPGSVEPLDRAGTVWTTRHRDLIADLCDDTVDTRALGDLFDRVQAVWRDSEHRIDPRLLVNAFGVALGDLVAVRVPGLSWARYRDDAGGEVVLAHDTQDLVVLPVSSVAHHWGHAPAGWFGVHVHEVVGSALSCLATARVAAH